MDSDHRGLFAAVSDLSSALVSDDWPAARQILLLIPKDAVKHFRREERLMRRAGYSGYNWHRKQHLTASKRVDVLVEAALAGGKPCCNAVIAYFRTWLPTHIGLHDRMMAASIRNFKRTPLLRSCRRTAANKDKDAAGRGWVWVRVPGPRIG